MNDKNTPLNLLIEQYDTLLPFNRYLSMVMPEYNFADDMSFKICCPLHEERTPSFSYSHNLHLWTCFGSCHTSGRTVRFHMLWLQKKYGKNIGIMNTIKDLYSRFPHILPNPDQILNQKQNVGIGKNKEKLLNSLDKQLLNTRQQKDRKSVATKPGSLDEEILNIFLANVKNHF